MIEDPENDFVMEIVIEMIQRSLVLLVHLDGKNWVRLRIADSFLIHSYGLL